MTLSTKSCIFPTFTDDLEEEITATLPFVGPRNNVPLHNNKPLKWNHRVNLIGDKCPNPRIHICEKCERPILLYGRLIPCKHVFCYDCAKANDSQCLRCTDKVVRVEKNKLGAVYMCTFENCRRTYLSHRDLQAHIQHRHLRRSSSYTTCPSQATLGAAIVSLINTTPNPAMVTSPSTSGSAITSLTTPFAQRSKSTHGTGNSTFPMCTIPVVSSTRPNLITVPIHDETGSANAIQHSQQSKAKLSSKNPVISGKSPTFIPQTLVSLPRGNLQWPSIGSIQAPSSFTPSLQAFTPQTLEGYVNPVTNQWNLPLISDPRQTTINRHFYQ